MSEYRFFFSHSSLSILFDRFHCQVFMFSLPIKCKYSFVKVNGSKSDQRNAWWVSCAFFPLPCVCIRAFSFFFCSLLSLVNSLPTIIICISKNVCTSYLLMIRYKHFIKIDHKANENIRLLNGHTDLVLTSRRTVQ